MEKLFVSAEAFIALNDPNDYNRKAAKDHVYTLLNETVKVYTSELEVSIAAHVIDRRLSHEAMVRFLDFFNEEGVMILSTDTGIFREVLNEVQSLDEEDGVSFHEAVMVKVMYNHGIKKVFAFNQNLKRHNVIVQG